MIYPYLGVSESEISGNNPKRALMIVIVLAGGLTLCAGGVILFAYMRHQRNAKAESEKSLRTTHGTTLSSQAEPPRHERRAGRARRRQFIPVTHERRAGLPRRHRDRPQGGMGNIFTEEMDPLGEADAYLTHGHDEEAEQILKDAIAKDPARHELKFKLLAIYHQRQDEVAFYALAEELYATLGDREDELWDQVEAMGRSLRSDKPMLLGDLQADGGWRSVVALIWQAKHRGRASPRSKIPSNGNGTRLQPSSTLPRPTSIGAMQNAPAIF